jgi:hypothetical protein
MIIRSTPFGKVDSRVYSLIQGIETEHNWRLKRYDQFWNFYRGNQWGWTRSPDDSFVTINYCQRIVDTHVDFLMKGGFTVTIPDDPETEEYEPFELEFISNALEKVWKVNRRDHMALEMGQMGSITGDVFIKVSVRDDFLLGKKVPNIEIIPSQFVFPTFSGPYGPAKKIESVLIAYPKYSDQVIMQGVYGEEKRNIEWHAERWTTDSVTYYTEDGRDITEPNLLGIIPVVHIPNYPVVGDFFGRSDLFSVLSLQRELNEKATDISDVINYHGSPITIVKGAKIGNLEKGANRTWSIPADASIENLMLKGELEASIGFYNKIRSAMFEIAGVPEQVVAPTHQYQSGSAQALSYGPLLNARKAKIQTYSYGIKEVNVLILRMLELIDGDFAEKFKEIPRTAKYNTEVVFPPALPRNEVQELQMSEGRLRLGLSSKKMEMEKLGMTRGEIRRVIQEQYEENRVNAEIQYNLGQINLDHLKEYQDFSDYIDSFESDNIRDDDGDPPPMQQQGKGVMKFDNKGGIQFKQNRGNPNPVRPMPDSQGEKISLRSENTDSGE